MPKGPSTAPTGDSATLIASGDSATSIASGGRCQPPPPPGHPPGAAAVVRPPRSGNRSLTAAGELLLAARHERLHHREGRGPGGGQQGDHLQVVAVQGALAIDGYFAVVGPTLEFPDTGDIQADLDRAGTVVHRAATRHHRWSRRGRTHRRRAERPRIWRRRCASAIRCRAASSRSTSSGGPSTGANCDPTSTRRWSSTNCGSLLRPAAPADLPLTDEFARALVHNLIVGLRAR